MKILFVIPSLAGGGQEKAGMILTNFLARFHDVLVVPLEPALPNDYEYKSPVERIIIPRATSTTGKIFVVFRRILALRKIKKHWKPDVSIAIGPTAMIINSLTFTKEQKISSIRQSLSKLNANRFLNKMLFRISGKLVPVHNGINEELWRLYQIKNMLYAYNGYELEKIAADKQEPVEENILRFFNGSVLIHMGRFDVQKCNWHLIKIFDLARKQLPHLKLLLIGDVDTSNPVNKDIYQFCVHYLQSKGYKVKRIGEQADPMVTYDVLMLGHIKNPHKYLGKADLFVFPSAWEGFPNALVEAMACGLPVVAADCPTGPKEILIHEKTAEKYGLLMPVFDHHFIAADLTTGTLHQQWANNIVTLIQNKSQMQYYKEQSLKRAADFSAEKSCKKWLEIIENKWNEPEKNPD